MNLSNSENIFISERIENGYSRIIPKFNTTTVSPPEFIVPIDKIVSFDLDSKVMETIRKETRNWGTLNWRDPKLGERYWGHVYLPIDPKIIKIIKEFYKNDGLLKKLREILDGYGSLVQQVDYYGICLLPPHFTVLSCSEFQHAFFDLDKKLVKEFDVVHDHSSYNSSIEHDKSPYSSMETSLKERKLQDLINFKLFETSSFTNALPNEITSHIKDFLLFDLTENGRRFEYSLTGRISLVPRYFGSGECGFVLHVKSSQLSQLRDQNGFAEKEFVVPLGKVNAYSFPQLSKRSLPLVLNKVQSDQAMNEVQHL